MRRIGVDLPFFPNLEFFTAIHGYDELVLFPAQIFRRRSFINRMDIRGPNKVQRLSIPIQGRRPSIPESDLLINYQDKWVSDHLRSIQSAYGKAPFFEYYFPYVESLYESGVDSLWELNKQSLTLCLRLLQLSVKVAECKIEGDIPIESDIRGQISTNQDFSSRLFYRPHVYFQLFGSDFEPNLSVLDLLFCVGPEAKMIIQASVNKTLNNR